MEEIAELDWVRSVVLCAKETEKCIVSFQSFSPCVITQNLKEFSNSQFYKFAPSYFTVLKILELKQKLQEVVVGEEWKQWKLSIPEDVGSVEAAILGEDFWNRARMLLQICEPFVRLFAALNIDRCLMGDVHEWRVQALDSVKNMGIGSGELNQLEELTENAWAMLFSPLHSAAYILNPRYFGRSQSKDKIIMKGWKTTLERYKSESTDRRVLRMQLSSYWQLKGSLGEEDAVDYRDKMDPAAWWENFGFEVPHLQTLAIKVLSQVSRVVMCEEIWQDNVASGSGVERGGDVTYVQNNQGMNSRS